MPSSIAQLVIGIAVALAMTTSTVIGIRSAEPQSHVHIVQKRSPTANPVSETAVGLVIISNSENSFWSIRNRERATVDEGAM